MEPAKEKGSRGKKKKKTRSPRFRHGRPEIEEAQPGEIIYYTLSSCTAHTHVRVYRRDLLRLADEIYTEPKLYSARHDADNFPPAKQSGIALCGAVSRLNYGGGRLMVGDKNRSARVVRTKKAAV